MRRKYRCQSKSAVDVSIHAPVKGATEGFDAVNTGSGFNSRTRKGCDVHLTTVDHDEPVSIHAPVKGATPESVRNHHAEIRFNSRTRKGCDSELFYRDEER